MAKPQEDGGIEDDPEGKPDDDDDDNNGIPAGYAAVGAHQSDFSFAGKTTAPTPRPTLKPTSRPTPSPTNKRGADKQQPTHGQTKPPPWERPTNPTTGAQSIGILEEDSDAHIPGRGTAGPHPSQKPTSRSPDLAVLDEHGNPVAAKRSTDSDREGLSPGGNVAVAFIVLLGIVIVATSLLLIQKRKRLLNAQNQNVRRGFFFMNMRKIKPTDGVETDTYDKTYIEEHNESLGSEEIDFNGPLFDSWPSVTPHRHDLEDDDGLAGTITPGQPYNNRTSHQTTDTTIRNSGIGTTVDVDDVVLDAGDIEDTEDEPSTFTSSLLSSFFSRAKRGGMHAPPSTDNAVDEIQRAINDAQWQEVYHLASKMAAEGNIDSNENLQSALVRSNENGNTGTTLNRTHLKPEDAARAAQLDLSMAVGDWITLAARAAVFAALESANNPVPASISFVKDQKSNIDECLTRAKEALEEAQKAEAKKQEQRLAVSSEAAKCTEEQVVFVDADEGASDGEFEYPDVDYSDFTRTSGTDDYTTADNSSGELPTPPSQTQTTPRPQSQSTVVEEVDSSDDEESDCQSSPTASHIPGPPSIAMSNQSTIPTQPSDSPQVHFSTIMEASRGPFRRDFASGMSQFMEQDEASERTPNFSV